MRQNSGNAANVDVLRWIESSDVISLPVQARSRATLGRIVDSAIDLFLARGYNGTTIDDIAEVSSASAGAIYSRFKDKSAILMVVVDTYYRDRFHIFEDFFDRYAEADDYDWEEMLSSYVDLLIDVFRADSNMIRFIESVRQGSDPIAQRTSRLNANMADRLYRSLCKTSLKDLDDLQYRVRFFHATFRNGMASAVLHEARPGGAQVSIDADSFKAESIRLGLAYFSSNILPATAKIDTGLRP